MSVATVDSARVAQRAGQNASHIKNSQEGSFRGANLKFTPRAPDAQSLLKDAAEEMSFKAAHERSKKKPLNERRVSTRQTKGLSEAEKIANMQEEAGSYLSEKKTKKLTKQEKIAEKKARPGTMEHFEALREKVPDLSDSQLKSLRQKVLDNPPKSIDELKDLIEKEYPDVTLRYVALMYLRKELSETIALYSGSDVSELIQQTKEFSQLLTWVNMIAIDLFDVEGAALRAGLNISEALIEFAGKKLKDSVGKLRSFYREAVLGYDKKLSSLYKKLLKKYGIKSFRQILRFLDRSIGCDMSSEGPSIDKEKLMDMMDDTFVLRALTNTHKDVAVLLRKTKYNVRRRLTAAENESGERDVHGTMVTMIEFIEKGFYSKKQNPELLKLLGNLGLKQKKIGQQIIFMNGLAKILREMPTKLFADQKKRLDMMQSVQATIDHLVGIELEE